MHVSVAFLRAFQSVLDELGVAGDVSLRLPKDPHAALPWDECARRLDRTLTVARDPSLGLRMGERISVSALHVVGHLLLTARNLREAAAQFSRFAPLVWAGAAFYLEEQGEEASYGVVLPPMDALGQRFCTELTLTVIVNVISALRVSGEPPSRVELSYAAPAYAPEYERVFGCRVRFDAPFSRVVFPRAMLDQARRLPDEQLKALLYERAERLLLHGERGRDIVFRVRDLLRCEGLQRFELSAVARLLGMSASTLRRRLGERGASFSDLVDEARRDLACEALRLGTYDIKELSTRLGFSEPRAFHRAFRRWTGTTPARYRSEQTRASA